MPEIEGKRRLKNRASALGT